MRPPQPHLVFTLAAIVSLGPLSVDFYLPALPSMVTYFGSNVSQVQLTLSSYLLGFALFHLVCGPLSDRFGRRPVLLGGLALYIVMSVACALAETITELVAFRFLQAMGACCAPTLGRAIVRDVYPPEDAMKALAYVSSLMALAPVIAPTLGGLLVGLGDWRLLFWALAVMGALMFLLAAWKVPETLPHMQALHPKNILKNYLSLIRNAQYTGYVLAAASLYAGAFAFVSGSSFVLMDFLGVSKEFFGVYFLFIVGGYVSGNLLTARVAYAWPSLLVFRCGIAVSFVAGAAMSLFAMLKWYHPMWVVGPVFFVSFGIGFVLPQAMALALKPFPHMAATASALMGFMQMSVSSVAGWLVGAFTVDNPLPMALVIWGTSAGAALFYMLLLHRFERQSPVSPKTVETEGEINA